MKEWCCPKCKKPTTVSISEGLSIGGFKAIQRTFKCTGSHDHQWTTVEVDEKRFLKLLDVISLRDDQIIFEIGKLICQLSPQKKKLKECLMDCLVTNITDSPSPSPHPKTAREKLRTANLARGDIKQILDICFSKNTNQADFESCIDDEIKNSQNLGVDGSAPG